MSESKGPLDPHRRVAWVDGVARVSARLTALVAEATATSALTPAEGAALRVVAAAPEGLSQSSWGRRLGVSRQRAHALAEGLVARGLVTMSREGRASTVRLTSTGAAEVASQAGQIADALDARLEGFAEDAALEALLDAVAARLG